MNWYRAIIGLTFLGLIMVSVPGCSGGSESEQVEQPTPVKALIVTTTNREQVKTYTGTLQGERQATIRAKLSEAVASVNVKENQPVKAGDVLIELDKYGSSSDYRRLQSIYQNAEKHFKKMAFLYKEGAVAESEHDAAQTEYEVAKANFEAVKRLVDIETPISGSVTSITVSEGDYVTVGQHIATVATTDRLRVRFEVNPANIGSFHIGDTVKVRSDAVRGVAAGAVTDIASSADPVSRTFEVEALIDNLDNMFKPGMFVNVDYIVSRLKNVIAVPRRTVVLLDEQPTVYTIKAGKASLSRVKTGPDLLGDVVIESGLSQGDTLVTLGQEYLEDGDSLQITQVQEQAI
jgi:RND family efflux transporter MFP subunit